jgi:ABC-type transport system involved in multi-copper enzyme maturation permease subunit
MSTALVIARNTISEALRRKILNAFLMVGIAVLVLTFAFQQLSPRQELTLIKGMGLGIISLAGLFITVILTINMLPVEIERRTIYTILSKPVRRHEFLLGKYFGALGTILINVLLMSFVFVVAVGVKQVLAGAPVNALDLFKGVLLIYMQLLLLCSLAMFFSTFLTPLVNFFLSLSLFVIGNLSSFTEDLAKQANNIISKGFFTVVHYLVPNFGNFNLINPLVNPDAAAQMRSEFQFIAGNVLYALVYSTVLLILAILVFDRREV